jgi:hypothetical protein
VKSCRNRDARIGYGGAHLLFQLLRRWRLEDPVLRLSWQKCKTLSEKQTKSKRAGVMVQVVVSSANKHEVLSSISSTGNNRIIIIIII